MVTYIPLSLELCHSFSPFISTSLLLYISLSLHLCLWCLPLSLSPSHYIYMKISLYSFFLDINLPSSLSISIALSLCFSLCLFIYLSFIISLSFSLQRSILLCVYFSPHQLFLSLYATVSVILSFPLIPTLPFIPLSLTS